MNTLLTPHAHGPAHGAGTPQFGSQSLPLAMSLTLPDEAATLRLGGLLGEAWLKAGAGRPAVILFYGGLGAGKTTLTRAFAAALPGGERAEVSSPSFTICNIYPTEPELVHCDLYRGGETLPEEAEDALERGALVLVEWAERLLPEALPPERLDIRLQPCHEQRLVTLTPHGEKAGRLARAVAEAWRQYGA